MDSKDLINSYDAQREIYSSFSETVSNLISRLLIAENISVHSVSCRCKTLGSLKNKIEKKTGYVNLEQITDLAGVRLITHYEDDVDKVAKIIESEFLVDTENSIDKRKALDPDRFGYLSLHYVISLRSGRSELKEYKGFAGLKAEVQIRSLLQHTWAEIEHDTGYKSDIGVPRHIRRRFSRLAGLLELADQEFIGIRDELVSYSEEVSEKISASKTSKASSLDVPIDRVSLVTFFDMDPLVAEIDREIAGILDATVKSNSSDEALSDVFRLRVVGIDNLATLKKSLFENREYIVRRAKYVKAAKTFFEIPDDLSQQILERLSLRKAISVFYLCQILAATSGSQADVVNKLSKMGLGNNEDLAKNLIALVQNQPL